MNLSIQRSFSVKRRESKKNLTKIEFALLINGRSLSTIFSDESLSSKIVDLFKRSESVVVYRSSPDEKAQTVKFIMKHEPSSFSLAIGDGANDVNMI